MLANSGASYILFLGNVVSLVKNMTEILIEFIKLKDANYIEKMLKIMGEALKCNTILILY